MSTPIGRVLRGSVMALLAVSLAAPLAVAKPGGGRSVGSRGSQTYSAPPSTATAPSAAQPMQRTQTPNAGPQQARPGMAAAAQPSRGLGFGGGLMAGLLGAGLLGMMFGGGFMGGLGGLSSMFGLLLQVGLIVGLVWLALRFFRRRSEPAMAGAGAPYERSAMAPEPVRPAMGGGGGAMPPVRQPVKILPADYQAFEGLLTDIQLAYGRGDVGKLAALGTPEMIGYFEEDLAEDRRRGQRNVITDPKLLQGDLAEAWREGSTDYATVAMRFSLTDVMVDAASSRELSRNPSEATELWTFRRDNGRSWILSAIQQTA